MDTGRLKKAKKDRLVSLARRSNIRGAHLMSKERLIHVLSRISARKTTKAKKAVKARPSAQKVAMQIKTLPQHRLTPLDRKHLTGLRERLVPAQPMIGEAPQQRVAEAKYYLGPAPQQKGHEDFQFPCGYGDNRIVIMVRDPWWLFSYWEIVQPKENEVRNEIFQKGLRPLRSVLRVYDVTDVKFNGRNAHSWFDIELTGMANNWYINIGAPNRAWIVDIGIVASNQEFFLLARSNCVRTPRFGMSEVIDEEWMCLEDDYWKMFGLSGGFGMGKASLALKEMFRKRLLQQVSSGGWSGAVSSISSPVKKRAQKGFWLNVDAELIVYGQTEPNAKVTVQNKPLHLRKDGTFTLRFALPDGRQEIPVVATSYDGDDTRTITPTVTRRTT